MQFEFATATRIVFGAGRLNEVGSLAKAFGKRALVVVGKTAVRAEPLLERLRKAAFESALLAVPGEPEIATVQEGTALAKREGCEFVISFGGGSVLDAGKAIAAMMSNDGDLLDHLEVVGKGEPLTRAPVPFIAIPTTAGTGSEVTRNAVLAAPERRVKVSLRSPLMLPNIALVDPELTHDLSPAITARTGLDALTQLIEPYVCSRANPMTDALCVEALPRVARSLREAFRNGRNSAAREDMTVASLFGGLALANSGLGAVHGFAGPLGGMLPAPHGDLCAALLPHVIEVNLRALRERKTDSEMLSRYEHIARLVSGNPTADADALIEWTRDLVADLGIPRLRTFGLTKADFGECIEKAARASSMKANPIVLTPVELEEILERAL